MAVEGVVPPLLPTFRSDLGLSTLETSSLLAVPWGVMFALAIPIGAAADRFGARAVTLVGGMLLAAGAFVQGLAPNFATLLLGRTLFGLALGIAWTAGIAWLAGQPSGGSGAIGGTTSAAALGFVVGPALGAALAEHFGTAVPFFASGALAVLVTVGLGAVRGVKPGRVRQREPVLRTIRAGRHEPVIAGAVLMVLLSGLANGATNLLVPLGLDDGGFSPTQIGVVFSAAAALFLVVSIGVARRGDALVHVRIAGFGLVATALVLVGTTVVGGTAGLLALVYLRVLFAWALLATITYPLAVAGARAASLRVGAIVGVVNVAWSLSATLGPLGGGALAETVGARGTFAIVGLAFATVGIWLLATDFRDRRSRRFEGVYEPC